MLCVTPFRPRPGVEHGCGQCRVCRLNRRREWTARIVIESAGYPVNTFATFTYSDASLPADGSLSDVHWRELTKDVGFRYFGVGEYGERTMRAHYHAVFFGLDPLKAGAFLTARWPYGFVHVGMDVTLAVARYIASYTVKKLTAKRTEYQQEVLEHRRPEFARMSRRPAIGWRGLDFLARWLATPVGQAWIARERDVPKAVMLGGRTYPLGRTMVCKLRDLLDVPQDDPLRRERREAELAAVNLDPLLKAERERMRYGRYDVLKARLDGERKVRL